MKENWDLLKMQDGNEKIAYLREQLPSMKDRGSSAMYIEQLELMVALLNSQVDMANQALTELGMPVTDKHVAPSSNAFK